MLKEPLKFGMIIIFLYCLGIHLLKCALLVSAYLPFSDSKGGTSFATILCTLCCVLLQRLSKWFHYSSHTLWNCSFLCIREYNAWRVREFILFGHNTYKMSSTCIIWSNANLIHLGQKMLNEWFHNSCRIMINSLSSGLWSSIISYL